MQISIAHACGFTSPARASVVEEALPYLGGEAKESWETDANKKNEGRIMKCGRQGQESGMRANVVEIMYVKCQIDECT